MNIIDKIIIWREKHIKEKTFVLILSLFVGFFTAIAAFILKSLVHFIQTFLTQNFNLEGVNYLYLVYPIIGIFFAWAFVFSYV